MKDLLRKLKLVDNLTTDLEMSRAQFVENMSSITDSGSIGMFSDIFEPFSFSKNELKGQINFDGFKIKRRRRFFDNNLNMAIANGTINERNGHLTIEAEINGFNNFYYLIYMLLLVCYSIFIFGVIKSDSKNEFFAILIFLLFGALMFSIPCLLMIRSVKSLKSKLEREFFFLKIQK